MKDIQLIIFDFDGTMCDSKRRIVETLQKTQAELGYAVSNDDACAETIGLPLEGCFKQIIPNLSDEKAAECCIVYRRIFEAANLISFPPLFEHVEESLKTLAERGFRMAIASSRKNQSLMLFCEKFDLLKYIEVVVGADNVVHPKPAPDPVLYILEKLSIEPAHTLVVGDMSFDILMGVGAGTRTCGVTYGNGTRGELEASGADVILDSFDALLDVVEAR